MSATELHEVSGRPPARDEPDTPPVAPTEAAARFVDEHVALERCRAVRALLMRPLLLAEVDPEGFALVRRHRDWIAERFEHLLGYRLSVRADHARLHKQPLRPYRDRPARIQPVSRRPGPEDGWRAFSRRHYVLMALLLAVLEAHQGRSQALIGDLATEVGALGSELGLRIDFERRDERKAFAEALDLLVRNGVLRRRDGSAEVFVSRDTSAEEALFDVEHSRLGDIKGTAAAIAEDSTAESLIALPAPATEEGERARRRRRIAATLVEEPVLYTDELTPAEVDSYRAQRHRIEPELELLTGLVAERRREGSALVDPGRALTDRRFPTRSSESQLALLLCARLRRLAHESGREAIPLPDIESELAKLRRRSRVVGGAEVDAGVLELMRAHRLIELDGGLLRVLPACARFAGAEEAAAA